MPKIYHFTSLPTALEFILPPMRLRTNFLNCMNGPKENQKWSFASVNLPYENLYLDIDHDAHTDQAHFDRMYRLGEEIKSKIQALCFVHSNKYVGYENEMMWAQYAANHKGICLEIDVELFVEENASIDIFKFQDICYTPKEDESIHWDSRLTKDENINQHIERDFEALFLSKSHFWKKEYEKRLLIKSDDFCFLNIKESLTGIYCGLSSEPKDIAALVEFINPTKTQLWTMYFEENRLKSM